jgi:hypothetical protein
MDASRVLNGQFGELWKDGKWLTNVTETEASVEIGNEDVKMSGTRWIGSKQTSLKGTGTFKGYKVTSDLVQQVGSIVADRGKPFVTELIVKVDDPEAWGAYRVRLKNVKFTKIDLIKYAVGSLVEEEWPFNFVGYDLLDTFTAQ